MGRNSAPRGVIRRIIHGLTLTLGALCALVVAVVIVLNVTTVGTNLLNRVLGKVDVAGSARLAVADARGNWITRLELVELRLARGDTTLAVADTIRIRVRPWRLVLGHVDIDRIEIAGVRVTHEPMALSKPGTETAANPPTDILGGGFYSGPPIRILDAILRDASYGVVVGRESTGPVVTGVSIHAHDIELSDDFRFSVERLAMRYSSVHPDSDGVDLLLSASLSGRRLDVDSLVVKTARSAVSGTATVAGERDGKIGDVAVDVRVHRLDLADVEMIPGGRALDGIAVADVSLHGPSVDRLDGTVRLACPEINLGAARFEAARLDAKFSGGRAELNAGVEYAGASVGVGGWARPLDDEPEYDLTVDLNGLRTLLHTLSNGLVTQSKDSPSARLHVAGRGYAQAAIRIDGHLSDASTRVEFAGTFNRNSEPDWSLERFAVQNLVLSNWVDDVPETDISFTATGGGRGEDMSTLRAHAAWTLEPSRFGDRRIESGSGRITVEDMRLGASLRVDAGMGVVTVDTAWVSVDDENGFDAARLMSLLVADGTIAVGSSALGDGVDGEGKARFSVRNGKLNLSAGLITNAGDVSFEATARPFTDRRELVVERGRFSNVDVGAWTKGGPSTSLNGGFSAQAKMVAGRNASAPSGSLTVEVDSSRVAGRILSGGMIVAGLANNVAFATGHLDIDEDRVLLDADGEVGPDRKSGRLRAVVPFGLLAALANRDSLDADGSLNVDATFARSGKDPASASLRVGGSGNLGALSLDSLFAVARLADNVVSLDSLSVRSNAGLIVGSGQVAGADSSGMSSSDLEVQVELNAPQHLFSLFGDGAGVPLEEAAAQLRLRGDSLSAKIDARLDDVHRVDLTASARRDSGAVLVWLSDVQVHAAIKNWRLVRPTRLTVAAGRVDVDSLEMNADRDRVLANGTFGRLGEQRFDVEIVDVGIDMLDRWLGRDKLEGRLNGRFSLRGSAAEPRASGALRIDTRLAGVQTGVADAKVWWDGQIVDLNAAFTSPAGDSLKTRGRFPLAATLSANAATVDSTAGHGVDEIEIDLDARRFPLSVLVPLAPADAIGSLRGSLDADIAFRGKGRTLSGSGRIAVTDGAVGLPSLGVDFEDIQFDSELSGGVLRLRRATMKSMDGELEISGTIRVPGPRQIEPRLSVSLRDFLAVDQSDLKVVASGELELSGSLSAPVLRGDLTLNNCTYYLSQKAMSGAQGTEAIELTPEDIEMLEETFGYEVRSDQAPTQEVFEGADVDLRVALVRDNWLRKRKNPRLAVELKGDVHARKLPFGEIELQGSIAPAPRGGYVEYFGRTFEIVGGSVQLNGPMDEHTADIRTEYKVRPPLGSGDPEVVVKLDVQGRGDQFSVALSSQPPLTETEIISYVTTGRSPTTSSANGASHGDDALALATDIGLSQLTGALEDVTKEKIGLDVVQVRYDALLGATLMAGSYLNPALYVGFRQPLQYRDSSTTSTQRPYQTAVELEYALFRWLVVNFQAESSLLRSVLRARHEF